MKLPKGVQISHGWYVYRPWDKETKSYTPQKRLVPEGSSYTELIDAYNSITSTSVWNLRSLINKYLESPQYDNLTKATKFGYIQCAKTIDKQKLTNGKSLLDIAFDQWSPGLVRRYLDTRTAKTQGNREVQFMRSVFSWGYERDFCNNNPCKDVRLNHKKPRTRYVNDADFNFVYKIASERMQLAMLLAWKCRLRRSEVLNLMRKHLTKDGIVCERSKGSKTTVVYWDEKLRKAVNSWTAVTTISGPEAFVVHNGDGKRFKREAFATEWQRLMKKSLNEGLEERFTFHDLKAKGISDDEGDKQKGSGHRSASMINVYDRKPAKVYPITPNSDDTDTSR